MRVKKRNCQNYIHHPNHRWSRYRVIQANRNIFWRTYGSTIYVLKQYLLAQQISCAKITSHYPKAQGQIHRRARTTIIPSLPYANHKCLQIYFTETLTNKSINVVIWIRILNGKLSLYYELYSIDTTNEFDCSEPPLNKCQQMIVYKVVVGANETPVGQDGRQYNAWTIEAKWRSLELTENLNWHYINCLT